MNEQTCHIESILDFQMPQPHPFQYFYRSSWNHHIPDPLRLWSDHVIDMDGGN